MSAATSPAVVATQARVADAAVRPERGGKWRRRIAYVLLIGYAVLMFVPFAWTVITSFKTLPDSVRLTVIPDPFTTDAYTYVFQNLVPPIQVMFWNSLVLALAVTLTNITLGSLAGYAFARLRFRFREALFLLVLGTLMIPDQLRVVPMYTAFNSVGLTNGIGQYVSVILVLAISATSIFLLRQYFLTIPRDLEEAARIDGAGFFTTFWRVMLPLAGPAIAAVAILQFQGTWNGFFWPVVFLTDKSHYTLPIGLTFFKLSGGFGVNWPPLMAAVVIATVPILLVYVFFQRYFVEGIAASGVKG
ncbi:MAG TPA: carbohydrate ABC transporter permease [Candidatus Limnocylindrales bacterium]|jgi:multiple sugar transport system permease protein